MGVYFRFPGEDWEDLYWDDDYRGDQGLKTWLKKKYTGPYIYKGWSEHYLSSQQAVQEWISQAGQHQGSLQEQRFAFENPHLEALLERLRFQICSFQIISTYRPSRSRLMCDGY